MLMIKEHMSTIRLKIQDPRWDPLTAPDDQLLNWFDDLYYYSTIIELEQISDDLYRCVTPDTHPDYLATRYRLIDNQVYTEGQVANRTYLESVEAFSPIGVVVE